MKTAWMCKSCRKGTISVPDDERFVVKLSNGEATGICRECLKTDLRDNLDEVPDEIFDTKLGGIMMELFSEAKP